MSESVEGLLIDSLNVTMGRVRPTSRRVRCLKAVSEVSLPGSNHSSPGAVDPLLTLVALMFQQQVYALEQSSDQNGHRQQFGPELPICAVRRPLV